MQKLFVPVKSFVSTTIQRLYNYIFFSNNSVGSIWFVDVRIDRWLDFNLLVETNYLPWFLLSLLLNTGSKTSIDAIVRLDRGLFDLIISTDTDTRRRRRSPMIGIIQFSSLRFKTFIIVDQHTLFLRKIPQDYYALYTHFFSELKFKIKVFF